jgi:hypothetical protein
MNTPPGAYSDELSLQQTSDGGYVLAGGTIGCGSGGDCPSLSGIQCGLIEKVDGTGRLVWAHAYSVGAYGTAFDQLKQTSDGGFVAVGSASDASHVPGALIVKLDGLGNVQWQRQLGPTGNSYALFNAVLQTADGGYVAAGELNDGTHTSSGLPLMSVLAVRFDPSGTVTWQKAFNDVGASGVSGTEHALSLVQTSDGGYAIGGAWSSDVSGFPGDCCQGALLLKLTAAGAIAVEKAYSGGVFCSANGYNTTCTNLGGVVYSLHQTADGGYVLAGDSNTREYSGLVPWLAKVDGSGALTWQDNDYQVNPSTGVPLSEYFASSELTPTGPLALGYTENYSKQRGELLAVQTDANGNVGGCSQIHPASDLSATDPGLTAFAPGLAIQTNSVSESPSPAQTLSTTGTVTAGQC